MLRTEPSGVEEEFELSGQIWNFLERILYDYPETYLLCGALSKIFSLFDSF